MKWHPQSTGEKVQAEQRFREIAEAYDVLIDPVKRHRFDDFGERGLKYPAVGTVTPYQYVGDPYALFTRFFGDASPLQDACDVNLEGVGPLSSKAVEAPIELDVACSIAELQHGATKRVVVGRTRLGPSGSPYTEKKPISLPVRAGWQVGMRITFRDEGNHTSPEASPGDLVFVITSSEKPMGRREPL
uniref:J domain-containing protein n=1 Tax=Noctiluca scintillans TaxID=2966 RepID=A0A7S1ALI5_NOCSC|mmetsp:Transcript_51328/g.136982  ORF Transcript_51328/g.136982 Transcript_51328/m.136982 type:complete len:188 (+) Transcript_51328:132-695(+)